MIRKIWDWSQGRLAVYDVGGEDVRFLSPARVARVAFVMAAVLGFFGLVMQFTGFAWTAP